MVFCLTKSVLLPNVDLIQPEGVYLPLQLNHNHSCSVQVLHTNNIFYIYISLYIDQFFQLHEYFKLDICDFIIIDGKIDHSSFVLGYGNATSLCPIDQRNAAKLGSDGPLEELMYHDDKTVHDPNAGTGTEKEPYRPSRYK